MAARLLSTPGWLSGSAAGTLQMAQFDVGGNKRAPIAANQAEVRSNQAGDSKVGPSVLKVAHWSITRP